MTRQNGFTLIELSIVLVIIGLIVGGVLVGKDLIDAAAVRAQVTQIEKYQTAVNTFRGKYGDQLPGDMTVASASMFGFAARGLLNSPSALADGDGNGIIEGAQVSSSGYGYQTEGEVLLFWSDLSTAGLIDFQFPSSFNELTFIPCTPSNNCSVGTYYPTAKIGNNNYVYVWSGGFGTDGGGSVGGSGAGSGDSGHPSNGVNYFAVSFVKSINGAYCTTQALSVNQAYGIDKKMDDGLPQSGTVLALYPNISNRSSNVVWAQGGGTPCNGNTVPRGSGLFPSAPSIQSPTPATSPSQNTCYDNGGTSGATQQYSIGSSGGTNINCALSFQFQ